MMAPQSPYSVPGIPNVMAVLLNRCGAFLARTVVSSNGAVASLDGTVASLDGTVRS